MMQVEEEMQRSFNGVVAPVGKTQANDVEESGEERYRKYHDSQAEVGICRSASRNRRGGDG